MSRGENEKKEDFFRCVGIGENRDSPFSGSDAFLCRTGNADCQVFQTAADHALRHNRADRLEYGAEHIRHLLRSEAFLISQRANEKARH